MAKKLYLILIGSIMLFMSGCSDPPQQIDFHTIQLPTTPNFYLVCPKNYCHNKQNALSPVYAISVNQLNQVWQKMIAKQPRVKRVKANPQKFQYTYIQRIPFLYFPDTINVKLIQISDNHSTIAIYSKSKYGYGDFGVNRKRIQSWLNALQVSVDRFKNQSSRK